MTYALNVRTDQLFNDRELRLSRMNFLRAARLIGRRVFLYRPSDEPNPGYYATALLKEVELDFANSRLMWVALDDIRALPQRLPLNGFASIEDSGRLPFYSYARTVRIVSPSDLDHLGAMMGEAIYPRGFGEVNVIDFEPSPPRWRTQKIKVREKLLRLALLTRYGPRCILTEKLYTSPSGRFVETQVGHLIARRYGGPDHIQNTLPMSGVGNWHWDNGLVALTNSGQLLVSSRASQDTRALFEHGRRIRFTDSQAWPKAEYLEWHRDNIFEHGHREELMWTGSSA